MGGAAFGRQWWLPDPTGSVKQTSQLGSHCQPAASFCCRCSTIETLTLPGKVNFWHLGLRQDSPKWRLGLWRSHRAEETSFYSWRESTSLSSHFHMASPSRDISKTPSFLVFQCWHSSLHFLPPGMGRLPLPGSVHSKLQCSTVPRDLSCAHQLLNLISMPINKYLLSVLLGKPRWQFQVHIVQK